MKNILIVFLCAICLISCAQVADKPNVILILTDDQGYGDVGIHGNPHIQTPTMDTIAQQGVRFDNFHVGTTCAPTRSGLMTGRNCNRVGAWHTIMGRHFLRQDEVTIADIFQSAGYKTAMFGKWHLGDNYPYRPHDRGFDQAFYHGGGGVWQIPDYWNNDYFDDTYLRNGKPEKTIGYCTDVWFENAINYIQKHQNEPFFCYIATNAPHGPYHVPQEYLDLYKDNTEITNPNFYGMITNVDDNIAILEEELAKLGLTENTILIFMTDNGTSAGVRLDKDRFPVKGYNAGMRGLKGSPYDGGHRVPFFIRWPGKISADVKIDNICSYVDVLPTLLDLCEIPEPDSLEFDGQSLKPLLDGDSAEWPDRVIFTDTQRIEVPKKWKDSAVMTDRWRLIKGNELYDMQADPGQTSNVAVDHPETVSKLRKAYEQWWTDISTRFNETSPVVVGTAHENPVVFTTHDLHPFGDGAPTWNQTSLRQAGGATGYWVVDFRRSGQYSIKLRRWPKAANVALTGTVPEKPAVTGGYPYPAGKKLNIDQAILKIGKNVYKSQVSPDDLFAEFEVDIQKSTLQFEATLIEKDNTKYSAYFIEIEYLD